MVMTRSFLWRSTVDSSITTIDMDSAAKLAAANSTDPRYLSWSQEMIFTVPATVTATTASTPAT